MSLTKNGASGLSPKNWKAAQTGSRGSVHLIALFLLVVGVVVLWTATSTYFRVEALEKKVDALRQSQDALELKLQIAELKASQHD